MERAKKEKKEWKRITKMYGTLYKEKEVRAVKEKKMDPNLKQHLEYRKLMKEKRRKKYGLGRNIPAHRQKVLEERETNDKRKQYHFLVPSEHKILPPKQFKEEHERLKDAREQATVEDTVEFAEAFSRKSSFEGFESYAEEHA